MNILVIDDDDDLLKLIRQSLETTYQVFVESDVTMVNKEQLQKADLIILDVMMPKMNGFEFLRKYREIIDAPVIFFTAKDFEADKLEGFASGGDDYLTKPFSLKELRARVGAHLRREQREKHQRLFDGIISCDLIKQQFYVDDEEIGLTHSEFELCSFLMRHRGQSFSKEDIYVAVYGYDAQGDSQTTITERVKKIRAKFARTNQNPIQTIWGVGYKWQSKDHYGD